MAEKRKRRWLARRKRGATVAKETTKPPEEQNAPEASEDAPDTPAPIRKGIYLSALIYVEGVQPAADNFDPVAKKALKESLAAALEGDKSGLSMALKLIDVRNDIEQDDDEKSEKSRSGKEEKFEF
jgi:hypothetical protein